MSAVLADHAQLLEYATLFDEADISADLALDLSVAQLQQLMPSEALLGHALRLHRVIAEAARPQPRIPAGPAWQLQGQILGVVLSFENVIRCHRFRE
jgi:hypothetical protein